MVGSWTLLTPCFSHIEPMHLLVNMVGVYFSASSVCLAFYNA
jgi:membrane associated rhomboid family serine protease